MQSVSATIQSNKVDWTFNGALTRELTHCYHDYPARMIPQIARQILNMFEAKNGQTLFDPYCGTGTSLVEGFIKGLNVIGTDLNPLARLIAKSKITVVDLKKLDTNIENYNLWISHTPENKLSLPSNIEGISRLDFWFKPFVTEKLLIIKEFIDSLSDESVRLFFQVAFSETVRESSNTRNNEFKLYRYDAETLKTFNPDVFGLMLTKLKRNRNGFNQFLSVIKNTVQSQSASILDFNTVHEIPGKSIELCSIDFVITSPPYGDSHTTVAYGQYSRLSAAWLGLEDANKIDSKLMGSKTPKILENFDCEVLDASLKQISLADDKRVLEVSGFYSDLRQSINNIVPLIKSGGYACYVTGNRKVKGITLPTDVVVKKFFEDKQFKHINTFHRSIPNKRMPLRNSPSNISGASDNTMLREHIVVMQCS